MKYDKKMLFYLGGRVGDGLGFVWSLAWVFPNSETWPARGGMSGNFAWAVYAL
jgi:hypothetical protein